MSMRFLLIAFAITVVILLVSGAVILWRSYQRRARRLGYPTVGEYLRGAPSSDEEKRDAVSLALKGLVTCVLGLVFPPLLLIGVFPLFYGGRKVAWASMGLGLVDDADHPSS